MPLQYDDGGGPSMDYDGAGIQTRGTRVAAAAMMQASASSLAPAFDEGSSNGADVLLQTREWFPPARALCVFEAVYRPVQRRQGEPRLHDVPNQMPHTACAPPGQAQPTQPLDVDPPRRPPHPRRHRLRPDHHPRRWRLPHQLLRLLLILLLFIIAAAAIEEGIAGESLEDVVVDDALFHAVEEGGDVEGGGMDLHEEYLEEPDGGGDEDSDEGAGEAVEDGGGVHLGVEDEVPREEDEGEPDATADALPEAIHQVEHLLVEDEALQDGDAAELAVEVGGDDVVMGGVVVVEEATEGDEWIGWEDERVPSDDHSERSFYKELLKVIEASDVILEVLDACGPLGTRCIDIEKMIVKSNPNKRIVLLLNKIDLVPREAVEKWLKYLREELPAVAFKCCTQEQRSNLGWKSSKAEKPSNLLQTSDCLGAETLMKLLKNYARSHEVA